MCIYIYIYIYKAGALFQTEYYQLNCPKFISKLVIRFLMEGLVKTWPSLRDRQS